MKQRDFELAVDALKSLPGIGTKQAERIAYFLLLQNNKYVNELNEKILNLKTNVKFCNKCNNFLNNDSCEICDNILRDKTKLCVVSSVDDLEKINTTNTYNGFFYILNEEVDIKKKSIISEMNIKKIDTIIKNNKTKEIIFATNLTLNGEATNVYLKKVLEVNNNLSFYRLAIGLPINSLLNYADNETLKNALINRVKI